MYNCSKCPGYCCSYHTIPVTRRDLKRLAAHFGIGFNKAKAKFVVKNDEKEKEHGEFKMRRKADEHFGRICRFFDTETRRCTVYKARPATCRSFPGGRCGYYDFLSHERRTQEDPDLITVTWNK
jgi:Fe-S-cluster containining protein